MNEPYRVERGSGPALVCLHGIGSSADSFEPQLSGLGEDFRVVAWDAPGYARSADPAGPLTMTGYAGAAAELVKELGGSAALLGVSWGGVIAIQVAVDFPELVRGLVLVGASRGAGRSAESAHRLRGQPGQLAALGAEEFARLRAPALLAPDAGNELVDRVAGIMAAAVRSPGYDYSTAAMAETDLSDRLGDVAAPTLVMYGDQDTVTGPAEGQTLGAGIPHAEVAAVAGAGHLANQEKPTDVNDRIARFLHGLERS